MKEKKTIIVVEDEQLVQQTLLESLSIKNFEVYGYASAEEAFNSELLPYASLVVMDIQLSGMTGLEATALIKNQFPGLPVIMLTAFSEVEYRLEGFEKGADDYVIKPFFTDELLARINAVLKRYELLPGKKIAYQVGDLTVDIRSKSAARSGQTIKLSQTEFNLLAFLAEEEGHPVSKEQIIQKVWDGRYNISDNTIEVYINLLRNKIDKPFPLKLIRTKPGFGYYLSSQRQEKKSTT